MHRLLLLGDSLLAEVGSDRTATIEHALPGWVVLNCATSGFTAAQCRRQAEHVAPVRPAAIVVSVGTNDAVPGRAVEEGAFERDLHELLDAFPDARRLVLLPPGVDAARHAASDGRTNEVIDRFRAAAVRAAAAAGAETIDAPRLAAGLIEGGQDPFVADGLHLADAMYGALATELARLLR